MVYGYGMVWYGMVYGIWHRVIFSMVHPHPSHSFTLILPFFETLFLREFFMQIPLQFLC